MNSRNKCNLSKDEKTALKSLREIPEIIIRPADKGVGIVIQDYMDYDEEAINILSDHNYYRKMDKDPFPAVYEKFQ